MIVLSRKKYDEIENRLQQVITQNQKLQDEINQLKKAIVQKDTLLAESRKKYKIIDGICLSEEQSLLYPNIKEVSHPDAVERFLKAKSLDDIDGLEVFYSFKKLGKHKRVEWDFQREWRYIIAMTPMGLREMHPLALEGQKTLIRRLEDPLTKAPYDRFFLDLDQSAVEQMEVVLGPCMSEAEKIYVKALLKYHGLDNNWRNSTLRIRK